MSARPEHRGRAGFTLLEVIIATVILAMLMFALYRFISTTLLALSATIELSDERQQVDAVGRLVQSQLNTLPGNGTTAAFVGKANQFHGLSSDELTWKCRAGEGLMTGAAPGEYRVTLTVQPSQDNSSELELGMRRELLTPETTSDPDFFLRGGGAAKYNWLPLIRPIAALEIRYWVPNSPTEVKQWTDLMNRPRFVHLKIWKHADDLPYDTILSVPGARFQSIQ
jgi:prepilin-type N-terminal cleavage/methylation domain-containing protein